MTPRNPTDLGVPRDLAPNMPASDLLERILTTADSAVVDNEPARGSIRGCAITLAARLEESEAVVRELVQLKDGPRDADYESRKPLAWAAARIVAARSQG